MKTNLFLSDDTKVYLRLNKKVDLSNYLKDCRDCGGGFSTTLDMNSFFKSFLEEEEQLVFSNDLFRGSKSRGVFIKKGEESPGYRYDYEFISKYFTWRKSKPLKLFSI